MNVVLKNLCLWYVMGIGVFRFSWHGRALYRQDFPTLHILAGGLLILFLFPADDGHSTTIAPALGLLAGRSQANRQPYRPAYPCRNPQTPAFTPRLAPRHNHRVSSISRSTRTRTLVNSQTIIMHHGSTQHTAQKPSI